MKAVWSYEIPKFPDILEEVFYMVKKKIHLGPHDSFSVSWWLRVCRGYFQQQLDPLFSLECWQVYPSSLHLRTTSCCVLKLDRNKLERVWNWFQKSIGSSYPKPLKFEEYFQGCVSGKNLRRRSWRCTPELKSSPSRKN